MAGRKVDERRKIRPPEPRVEPVVQTCGLDHGVLHVRDLEVSRAWYMRVLGLRPFFECDGHAFLRTGNCQIGLFEDLEAQSYHELDHVCLRTELDEQPLRQALAEAKIPLVPRPNGRGWQPTLDKGIYIADPDGHILQVLPKRQWPQVLVSAPGRAREA
jgi:catechol-2,3-dioxygenase